MTTKEKVNKINDLALELSMGGYLSDWNQEIPKENILKELKDGKNENVDVWEALEYFDTETVADVIEAHQKHAVRTILKALKIFHPEDDMSKLDVNL